MTPGPFRVASGALAVGLLFTCAAVVAVMVVPGWTSFSLHIESGGANEVVFPVGYWLAAAAWGWSGARLLRMPLARAIPMVTGTAIVLHVLLLLAMLAPQLQDDARFSSAFYRDYARAYCSVVVVLAGAGVLAGMSRARRAGPITGATWFFAAPLIAGTAILTGALIRFDPSAGVLGLVAAVAVAGAAEWSRTAPWGARLRQVREWLNDDRLFVVAVFFVAFGLRLLYLQRVMTDPGYLATGGDGPAYDALAWSIATGNGVPAAFREGYPLLLLGYVWFVAAVYAIAGHSYFILCAVQSVFGALACVLLFGVARPLFGSFIAKVAAAFAAISFPLLFAAAAIGHQAIDVFLTILIVWLLLRPTEGANAPGWRWAGIGVLFGLAIAVRETSVVFLAFVLVWLPFAFRRVPTFRYGRAAVLMLTGVALVVLPLLKPAASTAEGRLLLRQHFDRLYKGQGDAVRTREGLVGVLEDPGAALAQFRRQPVTIGMTLGRSIVHNFSVQFFTQPFGGFDLVFLTKGSAYYYGLWFYAYVLAGVGAVIVARQVPAVGPIGAGAALVLGAIAARTLPHLLLESHYRHRVPIEPLLILLAAVGLHALVSRVHSFRAPAPQLVQS